MDRNLVASELVKVAELLTAYRSPFPRSFYIPKDAVQVKDVEGTDLEIWIYNGGNDSFYGLAFAGKAQKPLWHYRFGDEVRRQKEIKETIESRKKSLDYKNQKKEERRNFKHSLKVDDILYDSWGYDQTNVDYYQVVEVGEKSVKIRKIRKKSVSGDKVVAVPNRFVGPAKTKIVSGGNSVKIDTGYASLWDGKPKYETPFGMGH